jgi:tRNA 2-thiocytidine biosynthesis protein TtcA
MSSVERRLFRALKRTVREHQLLAAGDRVLVALSGGKDSYSMLELLHRLKRQLPFAVELLAVHLDQQQPGYDGTPLQRWLDQSGYPYELLSEDTYNVVVEHTAPGGTYCAVCSRLRRGILYTAAERLGCTKIALGHHRDDALETLLMNLLYAGKLQAMPAQYTTDDGRLQVIRPLIQCAEVDIEQFAQAQEFPILPCNLCGSQDGLRRERMRALLDSLQAEIPDVRNVMLSALSNVVPTHLLDTGLLEAWASRPAHVRPKPVTPRRPAHHAAEPATARRLPLVQQSPARAAPAPRSATAAAPKA